MFRSLRTYYAKAQLPAAGSKQRWSWKTLPKLKVLLYFGSAGQWAILLYNVTTVKSAKAPDGSSCVVTDTEPVLLMVLYCYTMAFDFVVLAVCAAGLIRIPSPESRIWRRLNKPRNTSAVEYVHAFVLSCAPTHGPMRFTLIRLGNIVRNAHLDRPYQPNQSPNHRFQQSVYFPDVLPRPLRRYPRTPPPAHSDGAANADVSQFNVEEVHTISVPVVSINASRNGEVRSLPPRQYLVRTTPLALPKSKGLTEDEGTSRGSSTGSPTAATCSVQGYGYGWGTAKTGPPTLISKSFLWSSKKKGGSDSQGVSTGTGSGIVFASRSSEDESKFDPEDYGPGGVGVANVGVVGVDVVALDASEPAKRVSVDESKDDGTDNGTLVSVNRDSAGALEEATEPPQHERRGKESS
ncbi:hypothetical protein FRC00_002693 [Tulasnella sp. 408]|nr:hypothetical protein FRC00_002693 [Tulasnella sp. 408]